MKTFSFLRCFLLTLLASHPLSALTGSGVSGATTVDTRFVLTITPSNKGGVSGAGPYLGQANATLTATPQPGCFFTAWTGDLTGTQNPATLLMDGDKTVGATFVEDTSDPDGDGLTNYQEIALTQTNPLLSDSNGNGINDALEDTDNDGISNLREVTELKTDPLRVDTDADGLSDTYELVYKGSVAASQPRIGDRLRFELRELVPQGTLKLVGTLPTGLTFNALTGVLEGKLTGRVGAVNLSIQVLNGRTVLRTIPFSFTVSAFPAGLIGTWQSCWKM